MSGIDLYSQTCHGGPLLGGLWRKVDFSNYWNDRISLFYVNVENSLYVQVATLTRFPLKQV